MSNQPRKISNLGGLLDAALRQNNLADQMRIHRAVAVWPEIVGEKLAPVCWAESVKQGVLFVRAVSSVWANELTFYKGELLDRLAAKIGKGVVTDIYVRAGGRRKAVREQAARVLDRPTEPELSALEPESAETPVLRTYQRAMRMLTWKKEHGWEPCTRCHSLVRPDDLRGDGLCPLCARR
jgi:predicted nucleic acid-binding Zn ribbon protein